MAQLVGLDQVTAQIGQRLPDETLAAGQTAGETLLLTYADSPLGGIDGVDHQHGDGQRTHAPGTGV